MGVCVSLGKLHVCIGHNKEWSGGPLQIIGEGWRVAWGGEPQDFSRVENKVDSFVKEARREEILKIINYKEHCIRGYLAQHPHFIDYGRIKGEWILNVKHHFEMLFLKY